MQSRSWNNYDLALLIFFLAVLEHVGVVQAARIFPSLGRSLPIEIPKNNQSIIARAGPVRVMIVGDSITQGLAGDWTWRYRIWEWFRDQGVEVDFVGPLPGTVPGGKYNPPSPPSIYGAPGIPDDNPAPASDSGGYAAAADPNFDSKHFGAWGRQIAQDQGLIRGMVETYNPDLLLVLLGFNDVGWFINDAEGTFSTMRLFINAARAANPNIKMALGNIPQRSYIGGRDDLIIKTDVYNQILLSAIPWLSTKKSQIELVRMRENYDCEPAGCKAGYDGLHPNALGEYEIAQAFSRTLVNDFGIGTSELLIPVNIPVRPIAVPANVKAFSSVFGASVTWDAQYGVLAYEVALRLKGAIDWSSQGTRVNRYDTNWVLDGWEFEFKIRASNGQAGTSDWSGIVSAVCHPQTPGPPTGIITTPTTTGVDVSWTAPVSADPIIEWVVLVYDIDTVGAYVTGFGIEGSQLSASITTLTPGIHYIIAVTAWNKYGGGYPGLGPTITAGRGMPSTPSHLQITSLDPTTIHLDWCGSHEAAGYVLWYRNVNIKGSILEPVSQGASTSSSALWGYLFPGVWNYEFCVSAYNGKFETPLSACVTAPQPPTVVGGPVGPDICVGSGNDTIIPGGWGNPNPSCVKGTGPANHADLCAFTCGLGFCPDPCVCTLKGVQKPLPANTGAVGYALGGDESFVPLCGYACSLGYCPNNYCTAIPPGGEEAGGLIYVPDIVWNPGNPRILPCPGDCTFVIPPSPLATPEVISWPPLTTILLSSSGGMILTKTTIIEIPPFTISEIDYWAVTISSGDPTSATFTPVQSVMPPEFVITLPGTEATFPPSPYPEYSNFQPVSTEPASTTTPVRGFFFSYSHTVSIQPQPTMIISTPSPASTFTYSSTSDDAAKPTCTSHCGKHDCWRFGCGLGCGVFGCWGGCGYWGCGGGCGAGHCGGGCHTPGGCGSTKCPLLNPFCGGIGCGICPGPPPGLGEIQGGDGGDDGDEDNDPTSTKSCATSTTVTECQVACTITDFQGGFSSVAAGCGSTECTKTITGCDVTGTTVTSETTTAINCPTYAPYTSWWTDDDDLPPSLGIDVGYVAVMGTWTPGPKVTYGAPTQVPTPTKPVADPPFPTGFKDTPYCFSEHNNQYYLSFNFTGAARAIDTLCNRGRVLTAGPSENGPMFVSKYTTPDGRNVVAQVRWALNQNGCEPEGDIPMDGDGCILSLQQCFAFCDGEPQTDHDNILYGGGWISSEDNGCVEWSMFATKSTDCDCSGDGCDDNIPACCADGSCGNSREAKVALYEFGS